MNGMKSISHEEAVQERYAAAAGKTEASLCCPIDYNQQLLQAIPREVIEKDYGCGDPTPFLQSGETVLDLGSGTGKICFMASQIVGATGKIIGIDMTDEMLEVARRNAPLVAANLGYANVEFRKGKIQDLALDVDTFDTRLRERPIKDAATFWEAEKIAEALRSGQPLVATGSIDVVVSNCVLNLVEPSSKRALFAEIYRVLRPGGRAVISDIVSGKPVPKEMQNDPELWSGCISGALQEEELLNAFSQAGFHGIQIIKRGEAPWQTVAGIDFRSVTLRAFKPPEGNSSDQNREVIYLGPFKEVVDDFGHRFQRGKPTILKGAFCGLYAADPYRDFFAPGSETLPASKTKQEGGSSKPGDDQKGSMDLIRNGLVFSKKSGNDCC